MPRGFTSDGRPIMTKEEFVEAFATSRGYEKNEITGEWELVHPEMWKPKVKTDVPKTKTSKPTSKVTKPETSTPTKAKTVSTGFSKDIVIESINQFLTEQKYVFTADKATFMVTLGNDNYELKITRKTTSFEFEDEYDIKDFGKNKLTKALCQIDCADVGIIDKTGTVGFTNGTEYITIKITKKRK